MKLLPPLIAVAVLFAACSRQGDGATQQMSPGTWVVEGTYPSGGGFTSTIVVAPDGTYRCQILAHDSSNIVRTFDLEGTFQIREGVLVETTTKHSSTNAPVPLTSHARILRMSDHEIVARFEHQDGIGFATNETVFRKVEP